MGYALTIYEIYCFAKLCFRIASHCSSRVVCQEGVRARASGRGLQGLVPARAALAECTVPQACQREGTEAHDPETDAHQEQGRARHMVEGVSQTVPLCPACLPPDQADEDTPHEDDGQEDPAVQCLLAWHG